MNTSLVRSSFFTGYQNSRSVFLTFRSPCWVDIDTPQFGQRSTLSCCLPPCPVSRSGSQVNLCWASTRVSAFLQGQQVANGESFHRNRRLGARIVGARASSLMLQRCSIFVFLAFVWNSLRIMYPTLMAITSKLCYINSQLFFLSLPLSPPRLRTTSTVGQFLLPA